MAQNELRLNETKKMWHEFGEKKINRPENKVPKKIQAATNRSKKKIVHQQKKAKTVFFFLEPKNKQMSGFEARSDHSKM